MRDYELMCVLDPELDEAGLEAQNERLKGLITARGGEVVSVEPWGRRRLAYEINKKPEGIYSVIDLQAEPAVVKELDRQMNLNESVLRTKVLRPETH